MYVGKEARDDVCDENLKYVLWRAAMLGMQECESNDEGVRRGYVYEQFASPKGRRLAVLGAYTSRPS